MDVTLIDDQGVEQRLPTYHDECGTKANYHYSGGDHQVRRNLHLLRRAMTESGFAILDTEWWHFDDMDYYYTPAPIVFGHEVGIRISSRE